MYENDDGNDKFEAEFKAENVDKNGIWKLENGSTIDILNTTLSLPGGRGDEIVNGVILLQRGVITNILYFSFFCTFLPLPDF